MDACTRCLRNVQIISNDRPYNKCPFDFLTEHFSALLRLAAAKSGLNQLSNHPMPRCPPNLMPKFNLQEKFLAAYILESVMIIFQ